MKVIYRISFLLVLTIGAAAIWSCKRTVKKDEILGNAQLKSATSDFSGIIDPGNVAITKKLPNTVVNNTTQLRFGTGWEERVFFENTFSHEITWFVTFVGRTSKAVKTYTGTSKELNQNSFLWDGSANGRFFIKGDSIDYTLSFLGTSIKYTGTLFIRNSLSGQGTGPIDYSGMRRVLPNGDTLKYTKIDNMEEGAGIQTSYSDAADGLGKAVFYITDKQQVGGYFSYYMIGTDNNGNGYLGGSSGESLTELNGRIKLSNPEKVYINAYVYGFGRPNTAVFFQAFENDYADPVGGSFPLRDKTKNDMWYSIVEVNWTGWKLVSIPYSAFKAANNPASGGGGNRIQEPHKLCGFGIELSAYPTTGGTVEAAIDEVYITENGPFQQ